MEKLPTSRPENITPLLAVGLGASAGVIQVLQTIFQSIPAQSGLAFVVMHLSPDYESNHESNLAQVLQSTTALPVAQVTETVRVEPNQVYVIPPNRQLTLHARHIEIHSLEELRPSLEELQSVNEELTALNRELKSSLDELARAHNDNAKASAFRAALADALCSLDDPQEIQAVTLQLLGNYLGAIQVDYAEIEAGGQMRRDAGLKDDVAQLDIQLQLDDHAGVSRASRALTEEKSAEESQNSAGREVPDAEASIAAHVSVSLIKGGPVVAVLSVHQPTPRAWSNAEITIIEETAEHLWAASERARSKNALRASEEQFRLLVEGVTDYAMFLLDQERRIIYWNSGAERIFGYTREEALQQSADIIFTPQDRAAQEPEKELETALRAGRAADVRWHLRKDGTRFWANGIMSLLRDDSGEVRGFVKIARDATKEKTAEEALRQAHEETEERITQRTAQLARMNENLQAEIQRRRQSEQAREQLLKRVVRVQEEERLRISRELHDQMGQQLTALMMGLKSLPEAEEPGLRPPSQSQQLERLQQIAENLMQRAHNLAWQLRPASLDNLGMETTLRQCVQQWSEQSGIEAEFITQGHYQHGVLPMEVEIALYHVVQEALANIQRHAQAQCASVLLNCHEKSAVVIVEDNGCGFAADAENIAYRATRLGLLGMQERMELIGGTLTIESTPNQGTTIYARFSP